MEVVLDGVNSEYEFGELSEGEEFMMGDALCIKIDCPDTDYNAVRLSGIDQGGLHELPDRQKVVRIYSAKVVVRVRG